MKVKNDFRRNCCKVECLWKTKFEIHRLYLKHLILSLNNIIQKTITSFTSYLQIRIIQKPLRHWDSFSRYYKDNSLNFFWSHWDSLNRFSTSVPQWFSSTRLCPIQCLSCGVPQSSVLGPLIVQTCFLPLLRWWCWGLFFLQWVSLTYKSVYLVWTGGWPKIIFNLI